MKLRMVSIWKAVAVCTLIGLPALSGFLPAKAYAGAPAPTTTCDPATDERCIDEVCAGDDECNAFIEKYINPLIVGLTGLIGVVAVLSIVIAGIQYSGSADDPGVVTKAKQRVFNVVIGLVAYIFLLAFLNYLVPGGIF